MFILLKVGTPCTLLDSLQKTLISSGYAPTDGTCVRMGKDPAQYSTPHRKPECVKWEGGVKGLFFRRAAEGLCVGVEARRGPLTGGGQECDLTQAKKLLHCTRRKVGKRQTQLKSRKK